MASDPSKLRDAAQEAVNKGRYPRALAAYLELEQLDPANGDWARRAGEMYRRMDQEAHAVLALERAADKFARAGFLVKAVAVCKMILQTDPEHKAALERLASLQESRGLKAGPPTQPSPRERGEGSGTGALSPHERGEGSGPPAPPRRTLRPGAPLDTVVLGDIIPGSKPHQRPDGGGPSGIIEIAIDEIELDPGDLLEGTGAAAGAAGDAAAVARELKDTPLFSALSPGALQVLVDKMDLVEIDAGAALFRQGDRGNTLYVVADGEVAVIAEGPPRVTLARLGEGQFFGEIALVTDQPRSATIEAVTDTSLLAIDRDAMAEVIESEPAAFKVLLRFLRERLIDTLVHTSPLFQPFASEDRRTLAARFNFLEAPTGSVLIEQGGRAPALFIMLSGHAEVVLDHDGSSRRLATLGPGDIFGEMSLLAGQPAVATVRTTGKCFILEMPAAQFRQIIMTHPQVLMFVGDLADERRKKLDAVARGDADYEEGHIELL